MDGALVEEATYAQRTIYHCILNAPVEVQGSTEERTFTTMDLFPTTLAAMGFQVEGDRLGLGVNLFSGLPTLAERMGADALSDEL